MNKDQLKTAFAKGARIQAWRLNEGAVSSMDGFWDTFRHEPAFTCPLHLYRVHPEDLSLIAELGQDAAVAKYLPAGSMIFGDQDYETTQPCFEVVHRGCRYYMSPTSKQSIARLNEQDAAMRQEGGSDE